MLKQNSFILYLLFIPFDGRLWTKVKRL